MQKELFSKLDIFGGVPAFLPSYQDASKS